MSSAVRMLDIDATLSKMIAALPPVPAVPASVCDKAFHAPIEPAHYIIRTDPSTNYDFTVMVGGSMNPDTARVSCGTYNHVMTNKGSAALLASDVGDPELLAIKAGSALVPSQILMKKVGGAEDSEWIRFRPPTGAVNEKGTRLVYADKPPGAFPWTNDRFVQDSAAADKLYGIEYWKSFLPPVVEKN